MRIIKDYERIEDIGDFISRQLESRDIKAFIFIDSTKNVIGKMLQGKSRFSIEEICPNMYRPSEHCYFQRLEFTGFFNKKNNRFLLATKIFTDWDHIQFIPRILWDKSYEYPSYSDYIYAV